MYVLSAYFVGVHAIERVIIFEQFKTKQTSIVYNTIYVW